MGLHPILVSFMLAALLGFVAGIPLRHDMGNMSMEINTSSGVAVSYFNQGLRFTSTFKFDYAADSHIAALRADPNCAMCEWGLALAYGQNLNDALVMDLEPWFLDNEPLAYQAIQRARALISPPEGGGSTSDGGGGSSGDNDIGTSTATSREKEESPPSAASADALGRRDAALVSALALKYVETVEEYESHFVDGLPASLNLAYAKAMAEAAVRSRKEDWPDRAIVLLLAADAWMNISPWNYWEGPDVMRPNAHKARLLLEESMAWDPENPWAIHLYTHLMEAGVEAGAAVAPAQKLQYLVPGAPHLQHMQSHVEFRTGQWHEASQANLRAVALPDSDASYPDHNMDMLMWALGVEGRGTESKAIGVRLTAYSTPRVVAGVMAPLLPPERYLAQEALHLCAFADWEGVLVLDAPPEKADFDVAVYHYARSLAFIDAKDGDGYGREQSLITAGVEKMEKRGAYFGVYNAPALTKILDVISRAEGLRGGIVASSVSATGTDADLPADDDDNNDGGPVRRRGLLRNSSPQSFSTLKREEESTRHLDGLGSATEVEQKHPTTAAAATAWVPSKTTKPDTVSLLAAATAAASSGSTDAQRQEELELLRQAVRMQDALGYDEPPPLPVPTRLFLAAALLRGDVDIGGGGGGGGGGESSGSSGGDTPTTTPTTTAAAVVVGKAEAEEAEVVLRELDGMYPKMGRTLLGLSRASSALGKHDEALEFRERFLASWQHSDVWLEDSAHVGGVGVGGRENTEGGAEAGDINLGGDGGGGGDGGKDNGTSFSSVSVGENHNPVSRDAGSVALEEEEGSEKNDRGFATTTTVMAFAAVAVTALSLAAVAVVASRKRSTICCGRRGGRCVSRKLPWEQHLVGGCGLEETSNAARVRQWRSSGAKRNGYETIE